MIAHLAGGGIIVDNRVRRLTRLTVFVLLGVLLSPFAVAGTWASPAQNPHRQTVPELTPAAYMPLVLSHYSPPGPSVPDGRLVRRSWTLNGPFPPRLGMYAEPEWSQEDDGIRRDTAPYPDGVSQTQSAPPLCRLGMDVVSRPVDAYPYDSLARLRAGWYFNWSTSYDPPEPNGMRFAQSVFVKQWKWNDGLVLYGEDVPYAEPYTYTVRPAIPDIQNIAAANPGSLWLLGNEIERRDWTSDGFSAGQNEILPEVYAWAYHELYTAIKDVDPTARVANGSIIVPTPLRLQYMTRMWDEYLRRYGEPMPVDVWHIHTYLGPEKRHFWGIEIPAGIDADVGMFYFDGDVTQCKLVNKDFSYVPGLVRDFRAWMKERGQQNKPLIISEFGVSMPDWVLPGEFTPEKIRDEYMLPALTFMLTATDLDVGYPADEYRLVQSAWWWSLDGDGGKYEGGTFYPAFNGNLLWSGLGPPTHSPNPMGVSLLGSYWTSYASTLTENVNLRPLRVGGSAFSAAGEPVTVTVRVQLSNSGDIAVTQPFSVTLYDGGDQQIGSFLVDSLEGCGATAEAFVTWPGVEPGAHAVRVRVDPTDQISEARENDNEMDGVVLVATYRVHLPGVLRSR